MSALAALNQVCLMVFASPPYYLLRQCLLLVCQSIAFQDSFRNTHLQKTFNTYSRIPMSIVAGNNPMKPKSLQRNERTGFIPGLYWSHPVCS